MDMPAFAVIGYLEPVETTLPVACKLTAPKAGEHRPEFVNVLGPEIVDVLDRQNDMLWLRDSDGPPADLFVGLVLEVVCTFRAEKEVTAIGEFPDLGTLIA
jgi:hypothetical protein